MKRLTLSLFLMILFATIGIGWGIDLIFEKYSGESDKDLIGNYERLGKQLAEGLSATENLDEFVKQWNVNQTNKITLIDKDNFPLPELLNSNFEKGEPLVLESETKLSIYYLLKNKNMVIAFSPDEIQVRASKDSLKLILTLIFYMSVLSLIFIWLYPLIKRLYLLKKSAVKFGQGELSSRIQLKRRSYIYEIEAEFNRMAQKIETLVGDNKLISSAVSHDLRTPLARLRFGIDLLSDTEEPAKRKKYQQHLSRDINEMQSLVEVLLNYAKLEQSLVNIKKQRINLTKLLQQCLDSFESSQKHIEYRRVSKEIYVSGDKQYLRMLFTNLIKNAIEHATSHVIIEVKQEKAKLIVLVHDDGDGVPVSQRNKILKPFVRGDLKAKPNESTGYGMGLAIVERIAQWHYAQVSILKSTDIGGALFSIEFPL